MSVDLNIGSFDNSTYGIYTAYRANSFIALLTLSVIAIRFAAYSEETKE